MTHMPKSHIDRRELDRADIEMAARLFVAAYPHRAHEPRSWTRPPGAREQPQRWVVQSANDSSQPHATLVAYAALWRVSGEKYRFDVIVGEPDRRRGVGSHLLRMILDDASNRGAATLQARAYLTSPEALAFLHRRGFVETMRMRGFVLDLSRVEPAAVAAWAEPGAASGVSISIVSAGEASDPRFWVGLAGLREAAREGWPDADPGGAAEPMPPADLRVLLMPPGEPRLAFFVARDQQQFVGYSVLARSRSPGEAQFATTAVHPEYRGRGVATALRARCLALARHQGCSTIRSASGNEALITINSKFGFAETYCEVRLVKRLVTADADRIECVHDEQRRAD